jgi:TolA-binding protein
MTNDIWKTENLRIRFITTWVTIVFAIGTGGAVHSQTIESENNDPVFQELGQAILYLQEGQYGQAESICNNIVANHDGTDYALEALRWLSIIYIKSGNVSAAESVTGTLLSGYSDHANVADVLTDTANYYRSVIKDCAKSSSLYSLILSRWPEHPGAMWSRAGLAQCYLQTGDMANASLATNALLTDYTDHKDILIAARTIADKYVELESYTTAKAIYNTILTNWPAHERAMRAASWLVIASLKDGDRDGAIAAANRLLSDYSEHPEISDALKDVANQFLSANDYVKASQLFSTILTRWPNRPDTMWSQAGLARCYLNLGDTVKADQAVIALLTDHANHNHIVKAALAVAQRYVELETYSTARNIYNTIISNWPHDKNAILAELWLVIASLKDGDRDSAVAATDRLLADYSGHAQIDGTLKDVANQFMSTKDYRKASELFSILLTRTLSDADEKNTLAQLALCRIFLRDFDGAGAVTDQLIQDHSGDPGTVDVVEDIASGYFDMRKYDEAKEQYLAVYSNWPNNENTLTTLSWLAITAIKGQDPNTAEGATTALLTSFSNHEDIVEVLLDIAAQYMLVRDHAKAIELYSLILANWPQDQKAVWAQARLIECYIRMGNSSLAQSQTTRLLADFAHFEQLPEAVQEVARQHLVIAQVETANTLHQAVVSQWPEHPKAALSHLFLGNTAIAETLLSARFANDLRAEELFYLLHNIAESYRDCGYALLKTGQTESGEICIDKAIFFWEKAIQHFPRHKIKSFIYRLLGDLYASRKRYKRAVTYYYEIIDKYPHSPYAQDCPLLIVQGLRHIKDGQAIDEAAVESVETETNNLFQMDMADNLYRKKQLQNHLATRIEDIDTVGIKEETDRMIDRALAYYPNSTLARKAERFRSR